MVAHHGMPPFSTPVHALYETPPYTNGNTHLSPSVVVPQLPASVYVADVVCVVVAVSVAFLVGVDVAKGRQTGEIQMSGASTITPLRA